MLVFDENIFIEEAKKILRNSIVNATEADGHLTALLAYLLNGIAVSSIVEKVNNSMQIIYDNIKKGNQFLNDKTAFHYSGEDTIEFLKGIFEAYHETSLRNPSRGRFDVSARPLQYEHGNLVIRLIYYDKVNAMMRFLKKEPLILREELIESDKINCIKGDSNSMTIYMLNDKVQLQVTPFECSWLKK